MTPPSAPFLHSVLFYLSVSFSTVLGITIIKKKSFEGIVYMQKSAPQLLCQNNFNASIPLSFRPISEWTVVFLKQHHVSINLLD